MEEEFAFAEPMRPTRPGPLQKAHAWASRGRFARAKELLLFGVPGVLLVLAAFELNTYHWLNDPLALMLGLCGLLVAGFGFLPPIRRPGPEPVNPRSKRAKR